MDTRHQHSRRSWVALGAAIALLAAACGSSGSGTSDRASTSSASTSASPSLTGALAGCGPAGGRPFAVSTPDGERIEGVSAGSGPLAVVLSYEWGASPCAWTDVASQVVAHGHRAVLWEYGRLTGLDRIKELQAVVDEVRRQGATTVVLAGGSVGGCVSLIGASLVKPPVSAAVVLSCAVWYDVDEHIPTTGWAAKVRVPILYAVGDQDDPTLVDGVRTDVAAVPEKDKTLLVVKGSAAHGVALFSDPDGAKPLTKAFFDLLSRLLP